MGRLAEQLTHEKRKREISSKLQAYIRDTLRAEGLNFWHISFIVGAAFVAIGLIATGVGAGLGAAVIILIAALALSWGIDEQSTDSIDEATTIFGEREDREDERYRAALTEIGEE